MRPPDILELPRVPAPEHRNARLLLRLGHLAADDPGRRFYRRLGSGRLSARVVLRVVLCLLEVVASTAATGQTSVQTELGGFAGG